MTDRTLFWRTFAVLGPVIGMGPLAIDSFLPAMRAMADGLGAELGAIQGTLGAFIAGVAVGQILFGTLSDRFGRRPAMIAGLAAYFLAALALLLTDSVAPVAPLRFVQGIGTAAVFVISRAVVRDLFGVEGSARMFANLFLVFSIYPVLYPILGGQLTDSFGWRAVFVLMAAISGSGMLLVIFFLRESLAHKDMGALDVRQFRTSFGACLKDATFRGYLVVGAGAYIGLSAIIGGMAPVVIDYLGAGPTTFGYLYGIVMVLHSLAAAVAGRLVGRLGIKRTTMVGASIVGFAGVATVVFAAFGWVTLVTAVIANALIMVGFAFTNPAMTAGALTNFRHMAGRATALLGFLQQSTGALTVVLIGFADDGTPRAHAVAVACAALIAAGGYMALVRPLGRPTADRR